jgi:hypothetical protein
LAIPSARQRGRRPAIHAVVQFSPRAMPAQLSQRIVSYPHPIIFGQTKAAAG